MNCVVCPLDEWKFLYLRIYNFLTTPLNPIIQVSLYYLPIFLVEEIQNKLSLQILLIWSVNLLENLTVSMVMELFWEQSHLLSSVAFYDKVIRLQACMYLRDI